MGKPFPCFKSEISVDSPDILTDFKMIDFSIVGLIRKNIE